MGAVDLEIVAFWLARNRVFNRLLKQFVVRRGAQRRPQIRRILLAEAHVERAGAGDADAVAALAEIMGQRRDEAEPAAGLSDFDIAGRPTGPKGQIAQGEGFRYFGADL